MNKNKKMLLLIIIAIFVIVAILIVRNYIINKNKQFNTLDDFETSKEVIEYMEGKYIKQKESDDENFKFDIYATLKLDLYTEDEDNEEYYKQLAGMMAYTLKFENFRIIDEEKQNIVAVVCNKELQEISKIYINGYNNYFEREESKKQLEQMNTPIITNFNVESPELIQLINKDWIKTALNLKLEEGDNGYSYTNNGIEVKNVYQKVFNIVFNQNYTNNVVNGINTKMTLDEIIEILGTPTFGSTKERLIGYRNEKVYVFFTGRDISVYRVEEYETDELINIIKEYKNEEDIIKYISKITSMWPDYDEYNYDTNYINLTYCLKGIKIQYNITNKHGLIIGNNYKGSMKELENLKEELNFEEIYFENQDFVYETETHRVYAKAKG